MPSLCSCPYIWAAACSLTADVTSSSTARAGRLWPHGRGWGGGSGKVGWTGGYRGRPQPGIQQAQVQHCWHCCGRHVLTARLAGLHGWTCRLHVAAASPQHAFRRKHLCSTRATARRCSSPGDSMAAQSAGASKLHSTGIGEGQAAAKDAVCKGWAWPPSRQEPQSCINQVLERRQAAVYKGKVCRGPCVPAQVGSTAAARRQFHTQRHISAAWRT